MEIDADNKHNYKEDVCKDSWSVKEKWHFKVYAVDIMRVGIGF